MIRLIGAALAICLAGAATAQTRGGDDGALAWKIDIDPRIAEAAPELARFLREGDDAMLEEMQGAATRERADLGAAFRPHDLDIVAEARMITPGLVSVLRSVRIYSGGAHGNLFLDPLTWDRQAKDFVRLDHFLAEDAAGWKALQAIAKALKADLSARKNLWPDSVAMAAVPDPAALQSFTLEPSRIPGRIGGIAFHYAPYELGSYADGPQRAVIGQAVFRSGLKPAFQALFDGSPVD